MSAPLLHPRATARLQQRRRAAAGRHGGFTLLELLVAVSVLAIVSLIAWRGLDALLGTRERLAPRNEEARAMLATFGQIERDLAQTAAPDLFALRSLPVQVRQSAQGPVLEILRTAALAPGEASAVQTVFWRVEEGKLVRQVSAARRSLQPAEGETLSSVTVLPQVRALRIRVWRDAGWQDPLAPGAAAPPPTLPPSAPSEQLLTAMPQGVEIVIERDDGRTLRRVLLVGFSFGGYVSLALLQAVPERVSGVAMVCTAPNADTPAAAARRAASLQVVAEGRYVEATMAQAANAFHPDSVGDATLMAEREAMVRAYGPERFAAHVRAAIARPDRTALLDGRHPTLVVGGSHDALFTPQALAYAKHIPGARRVTIEGAGHLVPMERPAELAQCLADWARAA